MGRGAVLACRWNASHGLLLAYLGLQACACLAVLLSVLPGWAKMLLLLGCGVHAYCCLPRDILLTSPEAFTAIRHDARGWRLYSKGSGWQPIQVLPDSIALPQGILLRFRRRGRSRPGSLVLLPDAMSAENHRRLRLCLRFSRR